MILHKVENKNLNYKTIIRLFENSVSKFGDNVMFWEKTTGNYKGISYLQVQDFVNRFACGLLSLNIQKGDKVALLAPGTQNWVISELGVLFSGAVNVPLSIKLENTEVFFRLKHSDTKVLITTNQFYESIAEFLQDLPNLKKVIIIDSQIKHSENILILDEVYKLGSDYLKVKAEDFNSIYNDIADDDPAIISYTSGTTADPKGIILSHKNLVSNCEQSLKLFSVKETETTLLILPLDHSFAHTTGMYVFLASGASLASVHQGRTPNETLRNVADNIREIKPDVLLSVPTLAKNLKKNIEAGIKKKGEFSVILFNLALNVADKYIGNGWNKGKGLRILYKPIYYFFDKILFSKIRENFGGKLKYFVGGGALLDIELQKFFFAIGIPMYQGYGLSEASPVISANTVTIHKMGSSGIIVPGLQAKICNEKGEELPVKVKGEIVVKGDNVMTGYFKNEIATKQTIIDSWLYTGDMGYFDEDGFLYVLGRFKSLLIADDGEKFSPEGIEEFIAEKSKYINQLMVYNNQNKYTSALVFPEKIMVNSYLNGKGLTLNSEEGQKAVIKLLQNEFNSFSKGKHNEAIFPQRWLPSTFSILPEGFTVENHFLNSTLKMVRSKITDYYSDRIQYMYTPLGKDVFNDQNYEATRKM